MRKIAALAALALLTACASSGGGPAGPRMDWRCDGGAAFSARIASGGTAEVFAGGQTYSLPHIEGASGARYGNGNVEYWERGGLATLNGARGGPYTNCRRS
ncbi:MAG: MliC family protein [Hyphomonadaceae bacterium]|nr:MliC family protein [Hyphomonadaceae bacterium]